MSLPAPRSRIAIVVNDEPLLNALAFALEANGWEAIAFRTPDDLLEQRPPVDCLLVDHRHPGMDGLGVISLARERGLVAPALIIAGKPDAMFRRKAKEAGIRIVDKPLIGDELVRRIRDLVEERLGSGATEV